MTNEFKTFSKEESRFNKMKVWTSKTFASYQQTLHVAITQNILT